MNNTELREFILKKTNGYCAYCGRELPSCGWHRDHVIPRSIGGTWSFSNLVPSCKSCNIRKRALTPDGFRDFIKERVEIKIYSLTPDIREYFTFVNKEDREKIKRCYGDFIDSISSANVVFSYEDTLNG